jgi:molybdate transport system ATP-binding protein
MSFDVDIRVQRGDFRSNFAFASDAAVTALVGPSGHGKTSILLAIAGLVRPVGGHIRLGGRTLFDSTAGIDVPTRDRNLGMMFQDVRLFPHLSVRANLGYAGRATPADVTAMAAQLGLSTLIDRWPRHLSGGEARRVALGRALLARPAAMLLDEPLAHLDLARADKMIGLLAATSLEVPLLYVTHVISEAERLCAHIVLI